tara:strand:+ start:424 stop:840 length:417 start_codon:yes stop_codon:yes gene_type:complete
MNFGDFHYFFTHFPIALICLIGVIELLRLFIKTIPPFMSLIILFISTAMSFLSVQSGQIEKSKIADQNLLRVIEKHEIFGNLVMWYSIVLLFIWFLLHLKKNDNKILKLFLIFILIIIVIQTGFLGGELVHKYHIYSQ